LECARRLGEKPEKCAYVGDTTGDIVAGRAAGMRTIGVLTGLDDYESLREQDPDVILDSVSQLTQRLSL
jgi:phosphoglycolate phosphatase-like HAD superfamily hydrolase